MAGGEYIQPLKSNGTGVVPASSTEFINSSLKNSFIKTEIEGAMEQSPKGICAIALLTRIREPSIIASMKIDGTLVEGPDGYECRVVKDCINCGLMSALQLIDLGLGE